MGILLIPTSRKHIEIVLEFFLKLSNEFPSLHLKKTSRIFVSVLTFVIVFIFPKWYVFVYKCIQWDVLSCIFHTKASQSDWYRGRTVHKRYDEIQVKFFKKRTLPLRLIARIQKGHIPLRSRWTRSPYRLIYGMPGLWSA